MSWIGVDLDGTLAVHGNGWDKPGAPVPAMMERVRQWLAGGVEVRIMTARASVDEQHRIIADWCEENGLPRLRVTDRKDFAMRELWDDRAVRVEMNTGRRIA